MPKLIIQNTRVCYRQRKHKPKPQPQPQPQPHLHPKAPEKAPTGDPSRKAAPPQSPSRKAPPPRTPSPPVPIVFVHGAAAGAHVWFFQLQALSQHTRLFALDLPGHGCSNPIHPNQVTIPRYASFLTEFLESLQLPPCLLVGHSMGGAVLMHAALHAPQRVAGLLLASTAARLPVSPKLFQLIEHDLDAFPRFLAKRGFSPETPNSLIEEWTSQPLHATPHTVYADFKACDALDLTPHLPHLADLQIPTKILWGEHDIMVSRRRAQALADALTDSHLHIIKNAGHMVFQEAPTPANAHLVELLNSL